MINQTTKPKARQERPALKVMHRIDTDENGKNPVMTSKVLEAAPKLKEAVDSAKPPPIRKPSTQGIEKDSKPKGKPKDQPKAKDELDNFDYKVLHALDALGGKDVDSMTLAKKTGTTHSHPNAPRAPIRHAMEAFKKMGYVSAKKTGAKFLFSITERGKKAEETTQGKDKDKEAGSAKPASNPSNVGLNEGVLKAVGHVVPAAIRPANTDIQCAACKVWNLFQAEFCKNCGQKIGVTAAPIAA